MAEFKDDCFALSKELMSLELALEELEKFIEPVAGVERVQLASALSRFLAEDVVATRNVPPHDNSAVDGYAVFHGDLSNSEDTRLPVAGRITAGHPLKTVAKKGNAYRIFTGAAMPHGTDTVFMQEDVRTEGADVILPAGIQFGANRRFMGEDVRIGTIILDRGKRIRPQEIGLAASIGLSELMVYKPLCVAVFSTGDEICDPSADIRRGCIFDSNRYTVIGLLTELGCNVTDLGILEDDQQIICDALSGAAVNHDLIFTSGGVSVGEEDHVRQAVKALGSIYFWRLAIKPGRPIAFGTIASTPFVGLPGNPVAAMVTFMRIARILVLRLSGATGDISPTLYKVAAAFSFKPRGQRREWLRAHLKVDENGFRFVHLFPAKGSGVLISMVGSHGFVEINESVKQIKDGDLVDFLPFNEMYS
jgi:molybdopterin molybdotransferase